MHICKCREPRHMGSTHKTVCEILRSSVPHCVESKLIIHFLTSILSPLITLNLKLLFWLHLITHSFVPLVRSLQACLVLKSSVERNFPWIHKYTLDIAELTVVQGDKVQGFSSSAAHYLVRYALMHGCQLLRFLTEIQCVECVLGFHSSSRR